MRHAATLSLLALATPLLASGCVQQDKYDSLLSANRSLEEQIVSLEDERDAANSNVEALRAQLTQTRSDLDSLEGRNSGLNRDMSSLAAEYDELLQRIAVMEMGPLPEDTSRALAQLAASYPDLVAFDAKRGMLRFASDFTFDLGSVELKSSAQATLQELGRILNTEEARGFEARIVGHTDNVPIGRPETRQKHPTNVHLSVHRAISVRNYLVNAGVNPVRLQVAGYGEHRPIVANPEKGGASANRRVEIFLVPMPTNVDAASTTQVTNAESDTPAAPEPMK